MNAAFARWPLKQVIEGCSRICASVSCSTALKMALIWSVRRKLLPWYEPSMVRPWLMPLKLALVELAGRTLLRSPWYDRVSFRRS